MINWSKTFQGPEPTVVPAKPAPRTDPSVVDWSTVDFNKPHAKPTPGTEIPKDLQPFSNAPNLSPGSQTQQMSPISRAAIAAKVAAYARINGIPDYLAIKVANQESGFNPDAVSTIDGKPGAVGVMQILPSAHPDLKNPTDPDQNIAYGTKLLRQLYGQFGNWEQALAAYNSGASNIKDNRWTKIPATVNYVDNILGKGATARFMAQQQGPSFQQIMAGIQPHIANAVNKIITPLAKQFPGGGGQQPQLQLPRPGTAVAPVAPPPAEPLGMTTEAQKRIFGAPPQQPDLATQVAHPVHKSFADNFSDFMNLTPAAAAPPSGPPGTINWENQLTAPPPQKQSSVDMNNIRDNKPKNVEEWAQVLLNSTWQGFSEGMVGIPIGVMGVGADWREYQSLSPENKAKYVRLFGMPHQYDLPTSKTMEGLGKILGNIAGFSIGEREATLAGELIGRAVPQIPRALAGVEGAVKTFSGGPLRPIINRGAYDTVRVLTPMATGWGGVQAFHEAVKEIYDKGYIDPKRISEEALHAMINTYLFGIGFAGLGPVAGKTLSFAPKLLDAIPVRAGGTGKLALSYRGPGLGTQLMEQKAGDVLLYPPRAVAGAYDWSWKQAATILNRLKGGAPPGIQQRINSTQKATDFLDNFLAKSTHKINFPTWEFRRDGPFPTNPSQNAGLNPGRIFDALDEEYKSIRIPPVTIPGVAVPVQAGRTFQTGGGPGGALFQNELAKQLADLSDWLKQQGKGGFAGERSRDAKYASDLLYRNAGSLNQKGYKFVADALERISQYPKFFDQGHNTPTEVGNFVNFLRDTFRNQQMKNEEASVVLSKARSGVAHTLLGLGNVVSGLTVGNRISIVASSEGTSATMRGLKETQLESPLYNSILNKLGFHDPHAALTGNANMLSRISFKFYDAMERRMLGTAALARYYNQVESGVSHAKALDAGVEYARQLRTNTSWDLPEFIRVRQGLRTAYQFAPFAMKTATQLGHLNLEQFARYNAYAFALGGIKSLPLINQLDLAWTFFHGDSMLNSALANPYLQNVIYGLPGWQWNLDIGHRHNITQSIVNSLQNQPAGAVGSIMTHSIAATLNWLKQPSNGALFLQAVKASLGGQIGSIISTLDHERHGAVLTSKGFPAYRGLPGQEDVGPGAETYGPMALGLPTRQISQEQALQAVGVDMAKWQEGRTAAAETNLRRAILTRDPKEIASATANAIQNQVSPRSITQAYKDVAIEPVVREMRKMPRSVRPWLQQIIDRYEKGIRDVNQ